jgi:predicted esterase
LLAVTQLCCAETCTSEDFETNVSGTSECLKMRRYGASEPDVMMVWLHGDVSSGGPANYHFRIAESAASEFSSSKTLSVALVRPGYPDGDGNSSSVSPSHSGRSDHYTRENMTEVATAIEHLKKHFNPRKMIVIGHSGGAATTANILGLRPTLVDNAILVSCPCDLVAWRTGRKAWPRSENPIALSDTVSPEAKVIALTGERDDNTSTALARAYIEKLKARNIDATFLPLPYETHNSSFRSPEVFNAIRHLLP